MAVATKSDILDMRKDIQTLEVRLQSEIRILKQRVVIKLGATMAAAIGIVAKLARLIH